MKFDISLGHTYFFQEGFDVLVEPRLVPSGNVVDLGLLLRVRNVGEVAYHYHAILLENKFENRKIE